MDKNIKINKILNNGSSSETDLHFLAKELKLKINYIGSIYNLHSFYPGNYILLISPDKHILNGHWQSLYITKDKAFFFDSYGVGPEKVLLDNIKVPLYYNTAQIQALSSAHCGLWAIYWLYFMNKYKNYKQVMNEFLNHLHIYN